MRFYLGTQMVSQPWWDAGVPLFVNRRRLQNRCRFPEARAPWALDSGGYTELGQFGKWVTTERTYIGEVELLARAVGQLAWVAPQDWLCDPATVLATGLSVPVHQGLTIRSFLRLRDRLGPLVIPVLQGWTIDDYLRCADRYDRAGVDLEREPVVGVGSIAARQAHVRPIIAALARQRLRLHGFGVKLTGLRAYGELLASADSLAWSFDGRHQRGTCPEGRRTCANCLHHALAWRANLLAAC